MVVVPGICLCIMFYKYKTKVTQKRKAKQKHLLLQNSQNIEMEKSLYDNIDETDMLGLIEQIEIASDRIDVMIESNSTGSGENTSALDEGQNERKNDFVNQSVIKITPLVISEYLTQATVHCSLSESERNTVFEHGCILQHLNAQKNDTLRLPHEYDTSSINAKQTVPVMCFSNNPERVSRSCDNLNTAKLITCTGSYDQNTISAEENMLASYNISKTKSESDIFCNQIVTTKLFS